MNKVTVGPINSTAIVPLQCCLSLCSAKCVKCNNKKKKKKSENADAAKFSAIQTAPKSFFIVSNYVPSSSLLITKLAVTYKKRPKLQALEILTMTSS